MRFNSFSFNGTMYFYVKNLQGDVVRIIYLQVMSMPRNNYLGGIHLGFWGLGLYDNDTTSDINIYCKCKYWGGLDSKEVQEKAIKKFKDLIGTEEEPLLWLELADVQWDFSEIIDETKNKALSLIENHAFSENFDNPSDKEEWGKTLISLKAKLNIPPKEEVIEKVQLKHHNWKKGDVFAYRFKSPASKKAKL